LKRFTVFNFSILLQHIRNWKVFQHSYGWGLCANIVWP